MTESRTSPARRTHRPYALTVVFRALTVPCLAFVLAPLVLVGALNIRTSEACTSFCLKGGDAVVMGKNYDWNVDAGLLIVNKRGVIRTADLRGDPAEGSWTSRFGSVTFNQYGRDIPQGGINEAGLAIEILWLNGTEYPAADDRIALGATQWIQYQLDTAGSVADVLDNFERVRIEAAPEVHFFVADSSGACAAIEFMDGRRQVHVRRQMTAPVLTNHTYEESAEYLQRFHPWGGNESLSESSRSLSRFARAGAMIESYSPAGKQAPVARAFDILSRVSQGDATQWTIVYDLTNLEVHFYTQKNPSIRTVSMDELDFDCDSAVTVLDIHIGTSQWSPYSRKRNLDLVEHSFRATRFLSGTPQETLEAIADYPERARCQ